MDIKRGIGPVSRRTALVLGASTAAFTMFGSVPAHAHQVAPLPADNLIGNPWFTRVSSGNLAVDTSGWEFPGSPAWGTGGAKADCPGPAPWDTSCTLRWARNSGQTPEFHPNVEVRVHTVVAADSSHRTLRFFMHWVMHRMTLKAAVYGGPTQSGPWTEVWMPFQHTETTIWRPPPGQPKSDIWKHFTSLPGKFSNWSAPVPVVTTLAAGFPYYRVELRGSYPTPDATASGGVGGKVTGVYFATSSGSGPR